jgi:SAM-dependent methyltransferase
MHGHLWLVGVAGLAAGVVLMVFVPSLAPVSRSLLLFAGFHLVGAVVALASAWLLADRHLSRRSTPKGLDFGWAAAWLHGPALASVVVLSFAVAIQVAAPSWWPAAMALTLLAAGFFAGSRITRATARPEAAFLPMVELLPDGDGVVLDAGCGAGRTVVALARGYGRASVVAVDRFDAAYIEGGGRQLLERNLDVAGLAGRVEVRPGDLLDLPAPDASFDAAVSAHAMDHLGRTTLRGLTEIFRVVKPGGRFLLVVWVPGWTMFAISNLASLFLADTQAWRRMAAEAGFRLVDEGQHNGNWFLLLERPRQAC